MTDLHFQRIGLLLGLVAWSMQLIIFVQPFLPGGTMSGLGVCQTVVEMFSAHDAHVSHMTPNDFSDKNNNNQHNMHHSHHVAMDSSHPMLMQHDKVLAEQSIPVPAQVDHHFSHLSCGFCALYGHAVPPPVLTAAWKQVVKRPFITLAAFAQHPQSVILTDYIKPKSRAPPIIFNL